MQERSELMEQLQEYGKSLWDERVSSPGEMLGIWDTCWKKLCLKKEETKFKEKYKEIIFIVFLFLTIMVSVCVCF